MIKQKDSMHISFQKMFGYNKPFNVVISPREAGKTTEWVSIAYSNFLKKHKSSLVIRRNVNSISEAYIDSIQSIINMFYDESVKFKYNRGAMKDGIVMIYINNEIFMCICALSKKIADIKSIVLQNIGFIFFDEFILNMSFGEKYLKDEATKFKEIYNTFYRESNEQLKCFFLGNPYSLYNPYFSWWNVDTSKLKVGNIITGDEYVIWVYELTDELKEYILKRNPLYRFDDSYAKYGFEGVAINDTNIKIGKQPNNYYLEFVLKHNHKFVEIYKNKYLDDLKDSYFVKVSNKLGNQRNAFAFEFDELMNGVAILNRDDKYKFQRFKASMRRNDVLYNDLEAYYLTIEIYYFL